MSFALTHFPPREIQSISHLADVLQPVLAAAVPGGGEADVAASLPASADQAKAAGDAGHQEGGAAHQHSHGQHQDQHEGGRQEEVVLGRVESSVPAEEQRVEGGHGQSAVPQSGLQEASRQEKVEKCHSGSEIRSGAFRSSQGNDSSRA